MAKLAVVDQFFNAFKDYEMACFGAPERIDDHHLRQLAWEAANTMEVIKNGGPLPQ